MSAYVLAWAAVAACVVIALWDPVTWWKRRRVLRALRRPKGERSTTPP